MQMESFISFFVLYKNSNDRDALVRLAWVIAARVTIAEIQLLIWIMKDGLIERLHWLLNST